MSANSIAGSALESNEPNMFVVTLTRLLFWGHLEAFLLCTHRSSLSCQASEKAGMVFHGLGYGFNGNGYVFHGFQFPMKDY